MFKTVRALAVIRFNLMLVGHIYVRKLFLLQIFTLLRFSLAII